MARDYLHDFFHKVQIPLMSILVALTWGLILLRLRFTSRINNSCPSRWHTASKSLIIASGVLYTVQLVLWAIFVTFNEKILAISQLYHPVAKHTVFSESDMATMVKYLNTVSAATYILKIVLPLTLWCTKFAFLAFLLAISYCLGPWLKRALYSLSGFFVIAFIAVAYCSTDKHLSHSPLPVYNAENVIEQSLYKGVGYLWFIIQLESTPTALNIVTDITVTILACLIIRTQKVMSSGTTTLLVVMMCINTIVACARLAVYLCFEIYGSTVTSGGYNIFAYSNWQLPSVILTEYEVVVSFIVSCLPGMRAWWRSVQKQEVPKPETSLRSEDALHKIVSGTTMRSEAMEEHKDVEKQPWEVLELPQV